MPYSFASIPDRLKSTIGIIMTMTEPLPGAVDQVIGDTLGEPTMTDETDTFRIWRLAETVDPEEGQWFIHALQWDARNKGLGIFFDGNLDGAQYSDKITRMRGPQLDWHGQLSLRKLIERFREHSRTLVAEAEPVDEKSKGYQRLLYRVWGLRDPKLKPVDRLCLHAILRHCWSRTSCTVSEKLLAQEMGCSIRTLQRALKVLVAGKYLTISVQPNHSSTYIILRTDLIPPRHSR